jgi:DNA-binding PadR family transcriptional regulator
MPTPRRDAPDPLPFLPLTPVVFEILLSLAGGERHGYSIIREVTDRSGAPLRPGTLYRAIGRLLDEGLVEELDDRPDPSLDDERRRYYRMTPLGAEVAKAEARRLESQVTHARARRLLRGSGR